MKKVKIIHFDESGFDRIKHVKCYGMNFVIAVRLWILISLYYFLPQIHEKNENYLFH